MNERELQVEADELEVMPEEEKEELEMADEEDVEQQYLPYELSGREFYQPSGNGYEVKIREHMARIKKEAAEASSENKES